MLLARPLREDTRFAAGLRGGRVLGAALLTLWLVRELEDSGDLPSVCAAGAMLAFLFVKN